MQKIKIIDKARENKREFVEFIKGYNIVEMAVGVVIANSIKDLVTSIANNLIMPIVGLITPSGSWKDIVIKVGISEFKIGNFLASLLDFFIVAVLVFIVVKKLLKIDVKSK